jgi:hypothetical protein
MMVRMITRSILLTALFVTGCTEEVHVDVQCETTKTGVDCTLHQDKGKTEVETCWDFSVTCGNGAVVTAERSCGKVGNGATAKVQLPATKLHGLDKCETKDGTPPKATMANLTIDGKASTP